MQFQQNIETHAKEIAQLKKTGKQQTAEKKKLQSQLEEIRNSSTVIREIHELENQVATYKERQEKAERTKQDLESEWEAKLRQLETELVACRAKTEELEVMSRIEKVERKRQLEQVAQLVDRMKQKIGFEHTYAVKAAALAENQECPIFQLPLKRRLCPEIMGRSN
jgi:predicted RNase H-like nuclease (RuvC/YqgF family)